MVPVGEAEVDDSDVRMHRPTSRDSIGSYYQLAVVVPGIAIACLAGGVGALINGYPSAGALGLVVGLAIAVLIIWFLRLPVRDHEAD
jgi:hypothetical protein